MPTGEIVLIGSLMIRLLPASGTLPPPIGLHGTLAQWLDMERKARAAVEEERDAFAQRVGEIHQQLAQVRTTGGPELRGLLDEAIAARDTAEQARRATEREAQQLRAELDELRGRGSRDLEAARVEIARAREAKIIAETQAGLAAIEKLNEADLRIAALQNELGTAKKAAAAASNDLRVRELEAQLAAAAARADKADKELQTAQIRAQGAERNLSGATSNAAKAETRAAQIRVAARRHEGQAVRE